MVAPYRPIYSRRDAACPDCAADAGRCLCVAPLAEQAHVVAMRDLRADAGAVLDARFATFTQSWGDDSFLDWLYDHGHSETLRGIYAAEVDAAAAYLAALPLVAAGVGGTLTYGPPEPTVGAAFLARLAALPVAYA